MKKLIVPITFLILLILQSCTSDKDFSLGKAQLEQQGYTDVVNTGYSYFCCDDRERFKTGFKCKDKNGNVVKGCFCSDLFKGVAIRFE